MMKQAQKLKKPLSLILAMIMVISICLGVEIPKGVNAESTKYYRTYTKMEQYSFNEKNNYGYYMVPMIVIMPEIKMENSNDSWAWNANYNYARKKSSNGEGGIFDDVVEQARAGFFTKNVAANVDATAPVSVAGFSMGGATALLAGSEHLYTINVR